VLAALSMYDWPELRSETDRFWSALRDHLRASGLDAPDELERFRDAEDVWADGNLLITQTCGYPLVTGLCGPARLVATPCYNTDGCKGAAYSSWIITQRSSGMERIEDTFGGRVAINARHSQSGYSALRYVLAPHYAGGPLYDQVVESGGHRNSLALVADGDADICSVDAVCWAYAARFDPAIVEKLQAIAQTPMTPGLPFITGSLQSDRTIEVLRDGLQKTLKSGQFAEPNSLQLADIETLPIDAYDRIRQMEEDAISRGYAEIV